MAAPVWVLSVDLQAKTASFTTGLAETAKKARGAFTEIHDGAKGMGEGVSKSSINAQQALGVLSNTIRGDVEGALIDLVNEMSHTSIVMAAIPFAAAVGGAMLLVNVAVEIATKIKEWREEQEKLTSEETRFRTAAGEAFNTLDDKILEAGIRSDELRNNHLGALRKELELIDHASMADLVRELETIAKAADPIFKQLEGHWYTFGIGSDGAKDALEKFKDQYGSLLSMGKEKEAGDLLAGTLGSAEKVLSAQRYMMAGGGRMDNGNVGLSVDYTAQYRARLALQAAGVDYTEDEFRAQETLVRILRDQVAAQDKIAALKRLNGGNAGQQGGNEESARRAEATRAANASQLAMAEQALAAERATAAAELEIKRATIDERLASDLELAQREYEIKQAANAADIQALDRNGKDYQSQLAALQNKELELSAAHNTKFVELRAQASVAENKKELTDLQQHQRDLISATAQGSAARLDAIDAALKDAENRNQQDTDYYRQLGNQRVEVVRTLAEDEAKARADAAREAADNAMRMGELSLQAEIERQATRDSRRRVSDAERVAVELQYAEQEFSIRQQALQAQAEGLDTNAKDYENKLRAIQNRERQLVQAHENEKAAIRDRALIAQNQRALGSYQQLVNLVAQGLSNVLTRHQTFASMLAGIGDQVVSGMISNAVKAALTHDIGKPKAAAEAAREAAVWGWKHGGPAAPILSPIMAAGAFASVMAFAEGTDNVPGVGTGDVVPARLTPGEGVVPGGVMDGLRAVARNGGFEQRGQGHTVNIRPTYNIQTLDSSGVDKVLQAHSAKLQKHAERMIRRLNR